MLNINIDDFMQSYLVVTSQEDKLLGKALRMPTRNANSAPHEIDILPPKISSFQCKNINIKA